MCTILSHYCYNQKIREKLVRFESPAILFFFFFFFFFFPTVFGMSVAVTVHVFFPMVIQTDRISST